LFAVTFQCYNLTIKRLTKSILYATKKYLCSLRHFHKLYLYKQHKYVGLL